ncbi:hypothetical protein chiPu_0022214 [Chiloscyllium punctatum]|uniref:Uncharacterized protein n=1 Tax=Chiloscyllium punctatum TaxID=137246 RepID=A0A401RE80_CHIPU|nr:hypothetical protein [Chiloscyllium punctatum]
MHAPCTPHLHNGRPTPVHWTAARHVASGYWAARPSVHPHGPALPPSIGRFSKPLQLSRASDTARPLGRRSWLIKHRVRPVADGHWLATRRSRVNRRQRPFPIGWPVPPVRARGRYRLPDWSPGTQGAGGGRSVLTKMAAALRG